MGRALRCRGVWRRRAFAVKNSPAFSDDPDPFTAEIIQLSLTAITDEMFSSMARAAMSSVIYEVLDFGVAITDAEGELASAGAGIPSFVGMLDPAVKTVIGKFRGDVRAGDVFISNDPYTGGVSHINDVSLTMPVFHEDRLIAWTASKGHWLDLGGMTPGSLSPSASEVFQEGLILPDVRLFEAGTPVQALFDIIRANSRLPEQCIGDLWAGISALRTGDQRLRELCRKYGADQLDHAIRRYLRIRRAGLAQWIERASQGPLRRRGPDGRRARGPSGRHHHGRRVHRWTCAITRPRTPARSTRPCTAPGSARRPRSRVWWPRNNGPTRAAFGP